MSELYFKMLMRQNVKVKPKDHGYNGDEERPRKLD